MKTTWTDASTRFAVAVLFTVAAWAPASVSSQASAAEKPAEAGAEPAPLTIDHYVRVMSTVPSMAGEAAQLYVRERVVPSSTMLRARSQEDRVVVFVHGAGTPAEVAFDAPGASWMAYLARAGYDVFSMDMSGYGRSTRPHEMNDPCNLSEQDQAALVPTTLDATCPPTYPSASTTIESDWNDLDAVVEYVRGLRNVQRVHLAAWSLGGPRAGGYAARNPDKVASLILLSPAYSRNRSPNPPTDVPGLGAAMTKQSRADFDALWDSQLGCPAQSEPATRDSVWAAMLDSDPVGATWGTGVRRAPRVTTWGWGSAEVALQETPMLLIAPETDRQVPPERVVELYEDAATDQKILVHLACSSHNAMWETNREKLFAASLEWLESGTVEGISGGEVRLTRD